MKHWALISGGVVSTVVVQADKPSIGGDWREAPVATSSGDDWKGQNPAKAKSWVISVASFWDRFTLGERVDLDLAMQHNPADTAVLKKKAAKYRVRVADINKGTTVRLKANAIEAFLRDAETDGIFTAGRADTILLTPASPEELS